MLLVIVNVLVHIRCQKSALGEMGKSTSHLVMGRCIVESICVSSLYSLERIFFGDVDFFFFC